MWEDPAVRWHVRMMAEMHDEPQLPAAPEGPEDHHDH
jgi:hypothetical protein